MARKDLKWDMEEYKRTARQAAAEGFVLLKNDKGALPLDQGAHAALFGRSQFHYYKSGTGSGGMVNAVYAVGVKEAIEESSDLVLDRELLDIYREWLADHPFESGTGWADEPWHQEEMPVSPALAERIASRCDTALVIIGRTAGEDHDNAPVRGSLLLTETEEEMIRNVTAAFCHTIVLLNTGNIMDMKWVKAYDPDAVAMIWQGGQEGGRGVLDVLMGRVSPSGHLADTIAASIEDYPSTANFGSPVRNIQQEDIYVGCRYFETFARDKVLYPFGFGLSYTSFALRPLSFHVTDGCARLCVEVTNTGEAAGKEVVQVYVTKPQGRLGQPALTLCGFAKTGDLAPGGREIVDVTIPVRELASFDDSGLSGYQWAWVMEKGTYSFWIGDNVRDLQPAGSYQLDETRLIAQLSSQIGPRTAFNRIRPIPRAGQTGGKETALAGGSYDIGWEDVPLRGTDLTRERREDLPKEIPMTGDVGIRLVDVYEGRQTMEAFIGQLSREDLTCIVRGEGMNSPKVTPGCGGAIGGVTDSLLHFGIPIACVSDGPSGIRMDSGAEAFSLPGGTLLACTWNEKLQEELYRFEGMELSRNRIDALLGPGMNLHRNPQNGRNFEYFSEDPLLTGKCAAAQLRGLKAGGADGVIKHFAMNTQEKARHDVEALASERAAREVYLHGFEIAVKEGKASAVMTTYGPVNGIWTSSHYGLVSGILRKEWGFDGIVTTDWWAKGSEEGEPGSYQNEAAMVRARCDLNMVTACAADNTTHDNSLQALEEGTVTIAEYQRCASDICSWLMKTQAFSRFTGKIK